VNDTALAEADPHVGHVLAGRYLIVSLLGSGGMGAVYRAEHVHMKKPVAVKILHRHMTTNAEVVARFEREAVAAGRIEHPNVAAATDFGKLEDGSFYLALEYVEGRSLGEVLEAGALSPARALGIARQIADGLGAAHAAGIVHRDLKPDNVLLVERDGVRDIVKVLDFGIAKLHIDEGSGHQPLTQIGTIFGTPQYMSPEQGQGRTVDARSDLYALGVIVYEMLAGKLPFESDDLIVLITRHVTEAAPPLPAAIPEPVRALVAKLLEKQPEARVQSAALLSQQIAALLADPLLLGSEHSSGGARAGTPRAPGVSAASAAGVSAGARAVSLLHSVTAGTVAAHRTLVRRVPALDRTVTIGGIALPLVGVFFGGVALALLGALLTIAVVPARPSKHPIAGGSAGAPLAATQKSESERHRALLESAAKGDPQALLALDALPQKQKRIEDARALARGYCVAKQWSSCMSAYKNGVLAFPALHEDAELLADVRKVSLEPTAYEEALRLAAHQLGGKGLDLLWDVWSSTRQKSDLSAINRRVRQFLDDSAVREHATRELSLVFELERAEKRKRCRDAKSALPKILEYGDERLVPILDHMKATRGCGFVGLGDCWGCLRGNKELPQAREAASGRPGPAFRAE